MKIWNVSQSVLDWWKLGALDVCCVSPGNSSFGLLFLISRMAEKRSGSTQPQCQTILITLSAVVWLLCVTLETIGFSLLFLISRMAEKPRKGSTQPQCYLNSWKAQRTCTGYVWTSVTDHARFELQWKHNMCRNMLLQWLSKRKHNMCRNMLFQWAAKRKHNVCRNTLFQWFAERKGTTVYRNTLLQWARKEKHNMLS
jgi:hypothetical protein